MAPKNLHFNVKTNVCYKLSPKKLISQLRLNLVFSHRKPISKANGFLFRGHGFQSGAIKRMVSSDYSSSANTQQNILRALFINETLLVRTRQTFSGTTKGFFWILKKRKNHFTCSREGELNTM